MGSSLLISDTRGGGGPQNFLMKRGEHHILQELPVKSHQNLFIRLFSASENLGNIAAFNGTKNVEYIYLRRNVSSGVSKFDFSDNFVSKNSAQMYNFTSWHCRGASLSLRSKHFQPSSLFALVPTFSTNSGRNACYASYRGANFDRFSYTFGYRRPLESRGLQWVAPVRGGALDLCPV